jgi:hypothetical protein
MNKQSGNSTAAEAGKNIFILGDLCLSALQLNNEETFGTILEQPLTNKLGEVTKITNTGEILEPYILQLLELYEPSTVDE